MSVPISTYNQMQSTWAAVAVLLAVVPVAVVLCLWFVKNMMRTKSGKKIDSVKSSHKELLLSVTPRHRANLFKVSQFIPGVLETAKWDERVGKKRKTFHEPQKTDVLLTIDDLVGVENLTEDQKKQCLALSQECLTNMLSLNTEKVFLEDGVPMTLALEDKVIVAGVKGIGALGFYEKLWKVNALTEKISVMKESSVFKEVGVYLEYLISQVSLINPDVIRNYFDSDWNQNDEESQNDLHWTMGYRKGRKGEKGFEKWIIIGGIGIGIAGVAGGAVLAYLGK